MLMLLLVCLLTSALLLCLSPVQEVILGKITAGMVSEALDGHIRCDFKAAFSPDDFQNLQLTGGCEVFGFQRRLKSGDRVSIDKFSLKGSGYDIGDTHSECA